MPVASQPDFCTGSFQLKSPLISSNNCISNENRRRWSFSRSLFISSLISALLAFCGKTYASEGPVLGFFENYDPIARYAPYKGVRPYVFWTDYSEAQQSTPFIIEVNRYANLPPTQEQFDATNDLFKRTLAHARDSGWFDEKKALADGYKHLPKWDGVHYPNPEFLKDGQVLNPERPEFLMYYPQPDGTRLLVGVMFLVENHFDDGPQIGGPYTLWHFHPMPGSCWPGVGMPYGRTVNGVCEHGKLGHRSPEMIHIWFFDHPEGIFASNMGVVITDEFRAQVKAYFEDNAPIHSLMIKDRAYHLKPYDDEAPLIPLIKRKE